MNTKLEGRSRREDVGEAERGRLGGGFDQNTLQVYMKFSNNKNSFFISCMTGKSYPRDREGNVDFMWLLDNYIK